MDTRPRPVSTAKRIRAALWRTVLASRGLRQRLAWQLRHHYPADLDARVPIGEGLASPLFDDELSASFAEIFFQAEYAPLLDLIPLPRRWIDLGCYAGFFSLWLERERRRRSERTPSEALLVDANTSLRGRIEQLIAINALAPAWQHRCGAIAPGRGECEYIERPYMASSLGALDAAPGTRVRIPVLGDDELLRVFPPPFDLLKADIEGAESELLRHYPRLLAATRHLCVEWHSWHAAGSGRAGIEQMAATHGFTLAREIQPPRAVASGGETGVLLFTRPSPDDASA